MITLPISEVFVSHQGEGPNSGRHSLFVRLMGCPVRCEWCDTPYTWKHGVVDAAKPMTADQILDQVRSSGVSNVVITGGEPMIHARNPEFIRILSGIECGVTVEMETSGINLPPQGSDYTQFKRVNYRVSIKLHSAKVAERWRDYAAIYHSWLGLEGYSKTFKWVISSQGDAEIVQGLIAEAPEADHWLMPQATTKEELDVHGLEIQALSLRLKVNYSHRVHVALFGPRRGV